jgi:RNA-splicing ligase RtcB
MQAKEKLNMEEFTREMQGIYTTTATIETIDESPMAYKSINDILDNIAPTADVVKRIKPIYNFKAGEQ